MEAELREALATERRRLKKAMKKIDECKRQGAADTATERERRMDVEGMLVQSERKVRRYVVIPGLVCDWRVAAALARGGAESVGSFILLWLEAAVGHKRIEKGRKV
jgi:hypothetical protein